MPTIALRRLPVLRTSRANTSAATGSFRIHRHLASMSRARNEPRARMTPLPGRPSSAGFVWRLQPLDEKRAEAIELAVHHKLQEALRPVEDQGGRDSAEAGGTGRPGDARSRGGGAGEAFRAGRMDGGRAGPSPFRGGPMGSTVGPVPWGRRSLSAPPAGGVWSLTV
jgi:hypothetical protein